MDIRLHLIHSWQDAQRVALIPRAQRRVKIVPPRVTKASATGVSCVVDVGWWPGFCLNNDCEDDDLGGFFSHDETC